MWPLYRDWERWCGARLISRFRFVKLVYTGVADAQLTALGVV